MRAAVAIVALAVAFVTAQSGSVARNVDIASSARALPQASQDQTVRCFGVTCPVLPAMGSHGGLTSSSSTTTTTTSMPMPTANPAQALPNTMLAVAPAAAPEQERMVRAQQQLREQQLQAAQPELSATPFLPPSRTHVTNPLVPSSQSQPLFNNAQQLQAQQSDPLASAAAAADQPKGGAFTEQLKKLKPQFQHAGEKVQQFGHSVGERMSSFGKTIAGLGGGGGGGGGDSSSKAAADSSSTKPSDTSSGNRESSSSSRRRGGDDFGADIGRMPFNAQLQQQLQQPLQQQQQQFGQQQPMFVPSQPQQQMQQSPLRDAKMEAALQRGNLEPLTVVQQQPQQLPKPNPARGNTPSAGIGGGGTGTQFVQPGGERLTAAHESEGHGGGFGFGGGAAIVAAVPTPVTNVLPAVAPVVPAIPNPPIAPVAPPVAPVATLAAVPVAVPVCPHGHCI